MVRYEKGHKEDTRRHILEVAGQRFRKDGISGVGIAGIMSDADLTNGAFYAHFDSKEDLVMCVLIDLLDKREAHVTREIEQGTALDEIIVRYLSPHHRDHPEKGCVSAALISELAHHTESTQKAYTARLQTTFENLASRLVGDPLLREQKAIALFSMMMGALQLARVTSNKTLSDRILTSAATEAVALIKA